MSRHVVLGAVMLAVIGAGPLLERTWPWCPVGWSAATRIDLGESADVTLGGRPFRVGGSALLDYSLRIVTWPGDAARAQRHPLGVTASIQASSREALGEPVFTCFRVTRGAEVWARRPITYPTQTMADGLPPGAPPPAQNEAWRLAVADDGPEWPSGDQIALELWASVHGRQYVFVLPPFPLMKGG